MTFVEVWFTDWPTRSITGGIFFMYLAAVLLTQAGNVAEKNSVCGFVVPSALENTGTILQHLSMPTYAHFHPMTGMVPMRLFIVS